MQCKHKQTDMIRLIEEPCARKPHARFCEGHSARLSLDEKSLERSVERLLD